MVSEVCLEFMTGNPQLGLLSGRLTYVENSGGESNSPGGEKSPEISTRDSSNKLANTGPSSQYNDSNLPRHLPARRSKLLCILSVPAHMVPTDILQFAAPFKDNVHSIRILRPCNPVGPSDPARTTPAEYMVLLQMENQPSADDFFLQCNGMPFNSFEEAFCRVVFVATATFDLASAAASAPSPSSPPSPPSPQAGGPGAAAIPSTSFDASPIPAAGSSSSGGGGGGGPPPVAAVTPRPPPLRAALRFSPIAGGSHSGGGIVGGGAGATAATAAAAAGVGGGLLSPDKKATTATAGAAAGAAAGWEYDASTCVICMDRMESRVLTTVCNHSFHVECLMKWQDSPCPVCRFHHNNASEASTCQECQATDNLWVCLICGSVVCGSRHEDHVRAHYTKTLHAYAIEIETQQVWDFAGDGFVHRLIHNKADGKLVEVSDPGQTSEERPQMPARLSDIQEERLVHGKLEGLAYQYNTLLTSQLDEQRHFYEKQLNGLLEQHEKGRRERKARMVSGADLVSALRQQKREIESKYANASARLQKIREETGFLWELNRSLEANKPQLEANVEQARRDLDSARKTREEWVPQLEAKVAALMLKLSDDAGAAAAAAAGKGTAVVGGGAAGCAAAGGAGGRSGGDQNGEGSVVADVASAAAAAAAAAAAEAAVGGSVSPASAPGMAKNTPSATGTGAGRKEGTARGGVEETKGAGAGAEAGAGAGLAGGGGGGRRTAKGTLAEGSIDDERGDAADDDCLLSTHGGGSGGSSSNGKKKGRRRKSK